MRKQFLALIFALLLSGVVLAHICNNIYRVPDRVIVKPEKQTMTVVGIEEFRVFIQNNYPTLLNNIRLSVKPDTDVVEAMVTPKVIRVMKPGERTAFTVKLTAKPAAKPTKCTLLFSISADQIGFRPVEEATNEALREVVLNRETYPCARTLAAESLLKRKDPLGAETLARMATDPRVHRDTRSRAIRAIGKGGGKALVPTLKKLLYEEEDGFLKGNALLALGLLKEEASVFTQFFQDRDRFVRACAVAGLVLAGNKDKANMGWLKKNLQSTDVYVRIACGWSLAVHRDKDGVEALVQAFKTDDPMQRVMVGDALVDIATREQQKESGER